VKFNFQEKIQDNDHKRMIGMMDLMDMDNTEMELDMMQKKENDKIIDVGDIVLKSLVAEVQEGHHHQLQEVVVSSNKSKVDIAIDRKVYTVSDMPLAENATGIEVMKSIPSLAVDVNGNVLLRNAMPQIYLDGKPTDLTLDMISSDIIDKVELMTNPSSKYDASSSTGIINILTKKRNKEKTGYFGVVRLGIDRFGLPVGGGSFSVSNKKIVFNISLYGLMKRTNIAGTTERKSIFEDIIQKEDGTHINTNVFNIRPSLDIYLTPRSTLSIAASYNVRSFQQYTNQNMIENTIVNNTATFQQSIYRNGYTQGLMAMPTGNIDFEHLFSKKGEKLTFNISFYGGIVRKPTLLHQQQWNNIQQSNNFLTGEYFQRSGSDNDHNRVRIQMDYVNPIFSNMEISTGFVAQETYINERTNVFQGVDNPPTTEYLPFKNNFVDLQQVYAAYTSLSHQIALKHHNVFSYQVGLRAELFFNHAKVTDASENPVSYYTNYFKPLDVLYPSIFLSYKMAHSLQEIQLNYTRRVTRPSFMQLNPYINYLDSLNIIQGNPNLKSAFSHYAELNYSKEIKGNSGNAHMLLISFYANYTKDFIVNYQYSALLSGATTPVFITSYANAQYAIISGIEIAPHVQPFSWFSIKPSMNIYYSRIVTDPQFILTNQVLGSHTNQWSYYAKLAMDFSLPKAWSFQVIGDYYSRRLSAPGNAQSQGFFMFNIVNTSQGYIYPYYGVDVAIRKSFYKVKNNYLKPLSITLKASDIIGTRYAQTFIQGNGFTQYSRLRFNPFYVSISFSYRFGKAHGNSSKNNDMEDSAGGVGGGMMGM
ncbi:MAG: outer membrane beta-barrel protein, partial [Chitinophagaceae bacterium]